MRPFAAVVLTLSAACGSITDPTGPNGMPTSALFARKPPRPTPTRTPVLFVHGWNSSASTWTTMIGRFRTDGWQTSELLAFSYDANLSNAATAATIADRVTQLKGATGAARVAIVTHSMGTLSARYYVRNLSGEANVSAIISLAGANHGTSTAWFCLSAVSCQEMLPGSSFLSALNSVDETWGSPRYATWWSPCDEVINPRSSTSLAGATNTQTACLSHSQLHQDAKVYAQVRDAINQAAVSTFIASAR